MRKEYPVTCYKVDPEKLRSGKGLITARRKADKKEISQDVFDQRTEDIQTKAQERRKKKSPRKSK
jgi:hypothetical protein